MDIERLLADLTVDRVLTLGQVARRYAPGVPQERVRAAVLREVGMGRLAAWPLWVALTARARRVQRVDFVAMRPLVHPSAALRHLCGVAEVRWCLGPRVQRWDASAATTVGMTDRPDALAETRHNLLAVEYDAGAYSRRQVSRKAQTFRALIGQQVWGVASVRRAQWLQPLLPAGAEIVIAPWW